MKNLSRRRFIALGSASLAAVPLSTLLTPAVASELPMVDPESAQAKALQYAEASSTEGQNCANAPSRRCFSHRKAREYGLCGIWSESCSIGRPVTRLVEAVIVTKAYQCDLCPH